MAIGSACVWAETNGTAERVLCVFSVEAGPGGWAIEDDGVMGGLSRGTFSVSEEGHGVFAGEVSLDNNGGFSSVQWFFEPVEVSAFRSIAVRLKGDGKPYRLLVEAEPGARHYYEAEFPTSGEWETVIVPFSAMLPTRRGDRLDLPPFPGQQLALVRFMIANGRAESFRLEIDRLWLE